MIDKVRWTLQVHGLAAGREPLWVAVSGGCDSMVLLHVLRELRHPVHVVHVDHGLRDAESSADAAFVEATRKRIPLGRILEAEDIAGPTVFLLSAASSGITGIALPVDGGVTAE